LKKLRLTPRDFAIITSLANSVTLSTTQIGVLYFSGNTKKASERLKLLENEGLVQHKRKTWKFIGEKTENFYCVTMTARRIAKLPPAKKHHFPVNLNHLACTNQINILLRQACPENIVYDFVPSWQYASGRFEPCQTLVSTLCPDATISVSNNTQTLLAFLEIDLETEPLTRTNSKQTSLFSKLQHYCTYFDSNAYQAEAEHVFKCRFNGFRVLIITKGERRIDSIRQNLKMGDTRFIWCTTFKQIEENGIFQGIWKTAFLEDSGTYSLIETYKHTTQ